MVTSGLGPVDDGVLHLLLAPATCWGSSLSRCWPACAARAGRLTTMVLPGAWLLGGLAGLGLPPVPDLNWLGVTSFLVLRLLLAADAKLPPVAVATLAGAYG